MDNEYLPRLIEREMDDQLHSSGCVMVKGPKFCGKSRTCERFASSKTELKTTNAINLIKADPTLALLGEAPHLIDEWQKVPEIWNLIRGGLDKNYGFCAYILTGSTTPVDPKKIEHSGAGRISEITMRPMSLFESGDSDGKVSLRSLFEKGWQKESTVLPYEDGFSLSDLAFLLCRGGWPISVKADKKYARLATKNYYSGLFRVENESDEFSSFLRDKNTDLLLSVLRCYARNISTQAKVTSMVSDILSRGDRAKLDTDTFLKYKKTLENLFIIFELPAWNFPLRSSVSVRVAPTHHFFDPSIALASLDVSPSDLLNDPRSLGLFFEDMAIRDLSVYSSALGGKLKHYRDSTGREVDAILELENGEYAAIEIKLGSEEGIHSGVSSLLSFSSLLEKAGQKKPKFSMVLTSHGQCSISEEGVYIVSINHLRD